MTSSKPYLVRATFEWLIDNGMTPHLVANAAVDGVQVPTSAIRDQFVTLNIAPDAVVGLDLGNEVISFHARFGGVSHEIRLPVESLVAIYARENGEGIVLPDEPQTVAAPGDDDAEPEKTGVKPTDRSHLRVIK